MEWKGTELKTIGQLIDAICAIESGDEAQLFMAAYRARNPHADSNVGYLAGYCDRETAARIWDWFGCEHPVFGTSFPTPEEAFAAGVQMAGVTKDGTLRYLRRNGGTPPQAH